jgi:CheY-like chemotaxis protein
MPGMDGWMMIEALKNDPRTVSTPVIALTAHAMKGYRECAIASGFHNFLTKPLTPETFINDLLILLVDIPELNAAFNAA